MKNKVIKTMTLMAASALTLGATVPAFAAEETAEVAVEEAEVAEEEEVTEEIAEVSPVVGLWEGMIEDVAVAFEFNEDETYVAKFADAKVAEGVWTLADGVITLDAETPDEMTVAFDEAADSMTAIFDDEECVFARGEASEEGDVVMTMKAFMDKLFVADDVAEEDVETDEVAEDVADDAAEDVDDAAEDSEEEETTEGAVEE